MTSSLIRATQECNLRPRYKNHPFCGWGCAQKHGATSQNNNSPIRRVASANAGGPAPTRPDPRQTPVVSAPPPPPTRQVPVTPQRPPTNLPPIQDGTPLTFGTTLSPGHNSGTDTSSTLASVTSDTGSSFAMGPSPSTSRILTPKAQVIGERDPSAPKCAIPDCEAPPFQFGAEYCSMEHRKLAADHHFASRCVRCKQYSVTLFNFCGQYCHDRALGKAPQIFALDTHDGKYGEG